MVKDDDKGKRRYKPIGQAPILSEPTRVAGDAEANEAAKNAIAASRENAAKAGGPVPSRSKPGQTRGFRAPQRAPKDKALNRTVMGIGSPLSMPGKTLTGKVVTTKASRSASIDLPTPKRSLVGESSVQRGPLRGRSPQQGFGTDLDGEKTTVHQTGDPLLPKAKVEVRSRGHVPTGQKIGQPAPPKAPLGGGSRQPNKFQGTLSMGASGAVAHDSHFDPLDEAPTQMVASSSIEPTPLAKGAPAVPPVHEMNETTKHKPVVPEVAQRADAHAPSPLRSPLGRTVAFDEKQADQTSDSPLKDAWSEGSLPSHSDTSKDEPTANPFASTALAPAAPTGGAAKTAWGSAPQEAGSSSADADIPHIDFDELRDSQIDPSKSGAMPLESASFSMKPDRMAEADARAKEELPLPPARDKRPSSASPGKKQGSRKPLWLGVAAAAIMILVGVAVVIDRNNDEDVALANNDLANNDPAKGKLAANRASEKAEVAEKSAENREIVPLEKNPDDDGLDYAPTTDRVKENDVKPDDGLTDDERRRAAKDEQKKFEAAVAEGRAAKAEAAAKAAEEAKAAKAAADAKALADAKAADEKKRQAEADAKRALEEAEKKAAREKAAEEAKALARSSDVSNPGSGRKASTQWIKRAKDANGAQKESFLRAALAAQKDNPHAHEAMARHQLDSGRA